MSVFGGVFSTAAAGPLFGTAFLRASTSGMVVLDLGSATVGWSVTGAKGSAAFSAATISRSAASAAGPYVVPVDSTVTARPLPSPNSPFTPAHPTTNPTSATECTGAAASSGGFRS